MANFRNSLREFLTKVLSKPSSQYTKNEPNIKNLNQPTSYIRMNSSSLHNENQLKSREPYFFQIGFDFGTSNSKAIIRDINTKSAWIYTHSTINTDNTFLIPSIVLYQNGYFKRHMDIDILYPDNGLYHLKIAAQKIAHGIMDDPVFFDYKKAVEQSKSYQFDYFIELACIYFLSSVFSDIFINITQNFSDYGQNQNDQIAINMAIPVSDACDKNIYTFFKRLLDVSWNVSKKYNPFPKIISIEELNQMINECQKNINTENDGLCHVYPEVSANIQAFIRSPASSPDDTSIYFFNDTGAGTIDQCVFTYAGGKNKRKLNYFSAEVFLRGSSQIETIACGNNINKNALESWRKKKEQGLDISILNQAKSKLAEKVKIDTEQTLRNTLSCLPSGPGIYPINTIENKIKFIFSGGGHTIFPYQYAVIEAYKNFIKTKNDPLLTSMAIPEDLLVPKGFEAWTNRLFVAYGLSFLFDELAENSFPSDNKIDDENEHDKVPMRKECSCRGTNKNCSRCGGTGII